MLYPWSCIVCARACQDEFGICEQCYPLLPWCRSVCAQCGVFVEASNTNEHVCGYCQKQPPYFDRLYASLWYYPPVSQLIVDFKYSQRWEYLRLLVYLFTRNCPVVADDALFLPVPSHPTRIRERGFNAVVEFLRLLKKYHQINYDLSYLQRVVATHTQTGMNELQRRKNVKNAFKVIRPIVHSRVILFDDVVTTSATVNELSRCIKKRGVKIVEVWAIARTKQVLMR